MITDGFADRARKAPLFIIGSPRSGTTFLTRMVNRFLDIHVARDAGVFLRFYRMLPLYGELAIRSNRRRLIADLYRDYFFRTRFLERGFTLDADELCDAVPQPTYRALVDYVLIETARSHGKSGWGNKKPSYSLEAADADAVFPTAKFVHIIRDGRDVALSMRNATHLLLEQNWYFAARDWREHVLGGRELGLRIGGDRYLEIFYEDLLRDPTGIFARILTFIGAPQEEHRALGRIDTEIRGVMKAGNSKKWKTGIPPAGLRTIERAAGDLLGDLGYELMYPDAVGQPFSWTKIATFQVDRLYRRLFTRSLTKTINFKVQQVLTSSRAFRGRFLSPARPRSSATSSR